uniref:SUMO-specific isopeptidase USPL1 n=1 Tax=Semicossyphus pulcher TaxID=241346 RepID=UPI0037E90B60
MFFRKVQERAASLEYCPWCTSKGLTYALHSYRINLQESITLCTNPQCLFPLVSRPLEDVLASLVPVEPSVGCKRKTALALEKEELIQPIQKRLRSSQHESFQQQSITDSNAEHGAVNTVRNGQHAAPKTDSGKINGYHKDSPVAETGWESLQDDDLDEEAENATRTDGFVSTCFTSAGHLQSSSDALLTAEGHAREEEEKDDLRHLKNPPEMLNGRCSLDSNQSLFTDEDIHSTKINTPSPQHNEETARTGQKSQTADDTFCNDRGGVKSKTDTTKTESDELVAAPDQLFWKNSNNLCWLDSLLVALVKCKTLRKCKPNDEPQRSSVLQLLRRYEDICVAVQDHQQTGRDGVVRVPKHVLQKASKDLQSLRMSIFKLLQPKLQCKLGRQETPVFAMPLLFTMDSWAESLFQSSFHWEFKCSECKAASTERFIKTLPTLTNIVPDWRPLHAVHSAPCNVCCKKNQRRTMMLESLSPVFALHFVEGLPDNDIRIYTFTFKGKRYSITTVIQYKQQLKHFVTWIHNSDGSWVEFDDLSHPDVKPHQKLLVPAQEMHVVLWEAEEDNEPRACSPSSTFTESPPSKNEMNSSLCDKDLKADKLLACTTDQSMIVSHNDTDIVCALSASEDSSSSIVDTTITAGHDTSIGSTTLLDTFEGLSHNDIITLTLVELNAGSEMQPLNDNQQHQDLGVPFRNIINDSTPDSSSTVIGNETSQAPDTEPPTTSSESENGSSSDPTFVPGGRGGHRRARGVGRGKPVSKQNAKKAALSNKAPPIPASSEPPKMTGIKPAGVQAKVNPPPVEATQQTSPVSSTDASPQCTIQDNPTVPSTLDQNARWSFLLSKHPLHQVSKSTVELAPVPVAPVKKPTPPTHSTPNPVRKQTVSGGVFTKPQLKTEKNEGLPLKAAEMYGAFGAKWSNTQSSLPSPALLSDKSKPFSPILTDQKLSMNTTVVCGTSLPISGVKGVPEISSLKKHGSQSSMVPPGLNATEALRYKLIKKLKAKKKKLAKLNEMLGRQGGAGLRPDSTDLGSPNTVSSSTYDGSICDDFLSDLLSPATTASNLSPDSTGFLEMLAKGQDGVDQMDCVVIPAGAASQMNTFANEPNRENFLDDFLSQTVAQRRTDEETEALSALEYFI